MRWPWSRRRRPRGERDRALEVVIQSRKVAEVWAARVNRLHAEGERIAGSVAASMDLEALRLVNSRLQEINAEAERIVRHLHRIRAVQVRAQARVPLVGGAR